MYEKHGFVNFEFGHYVYGECFMVFIIVPGDNLRVFVVNVGCEYIVYLFVESGGANDSAI